MIVSFHLACLISAEPLLVLIEIDQTENKSDVTTADEICLANCRWSELPVFKICELNKKREKKTISSQHLFIIYPL